MSILLIVGCSTREVNNSLAGSTAQRLVTHSVDDLIKALPQSDFERYRGQRLLLNTHFVGQSDVKTYADQRLKQELHQRFGIDAIFDANSDTSSANAVLTVFYTSLATDRDNFGLSIHLGYIPGFDDNSQLNILTLEKFHGIAELYYYIGEPEAQTRSKVMRARTRTDALGLPFITIPLSNLDRVE